MVGVSSAPDRLGETQGLGGRIGCSLFNFVKFDNFGSFCGLAAQRARVVANKSFVSRRMIKMLKMLK